MSQRRIYTGTHPTVGLTGNVGRLEPGAEFGVPDEDVAAYDARPDVTTVPLRRGGRKTSDAGDASAPAVPDDGN